VKYRDADGRQIQETLGREADGWNRKKANAELRVRLVAVEKDGYRKPKSMLFGSLAERWLPDYSETKRLIPLVDRPREGRRRWKVLTPAETIRVERALDELVAAAVNDRDQDDRQTVRTMFLTFMGTGLRLGEALGLRWRSVLLADPDGAVLRVEETWVKSGVDTPKSQAGHRTIALGSRLAEELFQHRARTPYDSDHDRVFANPRTGKPFDDERYAEILRLALKKAGVEGHIRPAHDLRHSSITNAAAAGTSPEALMSRAGHSSYATTRRYIDLAGEHFREDADRLERRLWGASGTNNRYKVGQDDPNESEALAVKTA
jgi:integrase